MYLDSMRSSGVGFWIHLKSKLTKTSSGTESIGAYYDLVGRLDSTN